MKVQVFGTEPPCARCKATERLVRKLVKELGLDAEVEKVSVFSEEAERLGIMMPPAVVIDGKLVKQGGVPTEKELREALGAAARSGTAGQA
ncbi:MAG TPA: thioredoxin family protein [Methanomicrobia archaeon]|nr:thioredoxin family protein [Methanomicrobia archaeon]HEX58654.1 thioredoxin family protein [Methanomicrobia archaeon]